MADDTEILEFVPTASDPTPLADQLADYIRERVLLGELSAGTSLPPAGGWAEVGRSTVLQAYTRLRDDGFVSMLPSRGTVVKAVARRRRCAIILPSVEAEEYSAFELQIQVEVMNLFAASGIEVELYTLSGNMEGGSGDERFVPRSLAKAAADGLVAGAVLRPSLDFPGVYGWLKRHGIPVISMRDVTNPDVLHIRIDWPASLELGLRHLAERGHRRILLLNSTGNEAPGSTGRSVHERKFELAGEAPIPLGRRLAREWRQAIVEGQFDAVCITDDWAALGFLLELRSLGVVIPGRTAMMVACNSGQLSEAFADCERMLLSTRRIAEKVLELYRSMTTKDAPPVDPSVAHTIIRPVNAVQEQENTP